MKNPQRTIRTLHPWLVEFSVIDLSSIGLDWGTWQFQLVFKIGYTAA